MNNHLLLNCTQPPPKETTMPKSERVLVTPDTARQYLQFNIGNRLVRPTRVTAFAHEMKEGRWSGTIHQGIAFDTSGRLVDGQHRLLAIVEANIAVPLLVTWGVDPNDFALVDTGEVRKSWDIAKFLDDSHLNKVCCSIVSSYHSVKTKNMGKKTAQVLNETFDEMPKSFLAVTGMFSFKSRLHRSAVAAALVVYHHFHPTHAEAFFSDYKTGSGGLGSPVLALREKILLDRIRPTVADLYWNTAGAIKAHLEGRPITKVYPATEDLAGNRWTRLANARSIKGLKGHQTRQAGGAP